ncbi:hypothetical protein GCM10010106_14860 [Thermopolyspora flexuosa]|jgi:uncharacterized protein GlcG (DUF336 family)|uniref:Glc operon protein GlcG n=1 Tax=Thermopolyspora flexuosa TaxID=103836 RepID=A0A543IPR7_9ACTN|nr:heme-binding protein [Thermopolyspora flexuosa]TQM72548.1 glc operon protein GlcG [Thermopolyspora flexuosa]GGM69709.1 hypothetical protein GCM10010106_14860 [Thermopolyspora flexuosa]
MHGLGLDGARLIIDAALDAARAAGIRVSCCVVDAAGDEIAGIRMDGAPWFTCGVARSKARTAARMGVDSAVVAGIKADHPELVTLIDGQLPFDVTTLPGGVVIRDGQAVAGAVGVSGAHPDQDVAVARAGVDAWLGR